MATVILEGSVTPAAGVLETGERSDWVQLTPHVQDLIDKGYVIVVRKFYDDEDPIGPAIDLEPDEQDSDEDSDSLEVPKGNASTEEWAAFLRTKDIEIPVNDEGEIPGREGLKAIWQQFSGGA